MRNVGTLHLGNRTFLVKDAHLARSATLWTIEIETFSEEFDGEHWQPYLYHQGLKLNALQASELQGKRTAWNDPAAPIYPHPERGIMHVFGHETVYNYALSFGDIEGSEISLFWSGFCDVHWDTEFGSAVPFVLTCKAKV